MKRRKYISNFLTVLGVAMILISFVTVIAALGTDPVMVVSPDAALQRVEQMMTAVCDGDYKSASKVLYGMPDLGTYPENANLATVLIWEAFLDSLEYELAGGCYVADSGVAVDIHIRYLDVSSVIGELDRYTQQMLNQKVEQAVTMDDIYDGQNNYRQDMIDRILQESVQRSLEENQKYETKTVTLQLVHEQGSWWVMPNSALLNVLAGSFVG